MHKVKRNHRRKKVTNYRKRKVVFLSSLFTLFILILILILLRGCDNNSLKKQKETIRAGICGEVQLPAVYDISADANLSMLIRKANGLTHFADIRNINLDQPIDHDSIYHIPGRANSIDDTSQFNLPEIYTNSFTRQSSILPDSNLLLGEKDIRQINILYVGLPAVYIIINYFPELERVNLTHIPHSSLLLSNNYRLIDILFTLGVEPTKDIIQRQLETKLDYYIVQEKESFIQMINLLEGVEVDLDKQFAEAYDLSSGKSRLDGFYAWEYIRFLDFKRIKRKFDNYKQQDMTRTDVFEANPEHLSNAYVLRHQRQRYVINAMRKSFNQLNPAKKIQTLKKVQKTVETDLTVKKIVSLYRDMLSVPDFSYGRIPGRFIREKDNVYFFPDEPSYKAMRENMVRKFISQKENQKPIY
ncbi:MAG: LCP family protein [Bacteroidales bacterium]|nr:LCP family protein [Bacteroidales bacterium]